MKYYKELLVGLLVGSALSASASVVLSDSFNGSISPSWDISGTDALTDAKNDGPESAFSSVKNSKGHSLRIYDKSQSSKAVVQFSIPDDLSGMDGGALIVQFDFMAPDKVLLPNLRVKEGKALMASLSLFDSFAHSDKQGADEKRILQEKMESKKWYRVKYTCFPNGTADISLSECGGGNRVWTGHTIQFPEKSFDTVWFSFNSQPKTIGREYFIDNVVITKSAPKLETLGLLL